MTRTTTKVARRSFARLAFDLLFIAALLHGQDARAQGFIIPELGARVNSMGAAVGRPDDLSAIYHNPAALALLPGTQVGLSFGASMLGTDIRVRPWCNNGKPLGDPACATADSSRYITQPVDGSGYYPRLTPMVFAPIPFLGASTNLWSKKVVGALGVYVPNAAGATFGAEEATRYHIIDAYVISAYFTGAVGYRPFSWLAVGAGISAVYVRVHQRKLLYPVLDGKDSSILLGSKTELELDGDCVRPAFSLGIQAWPHKNVSLGFLMLSRYPNDVELKGPLKLKPGEDASPLIQQPAWTDNQQSTSVGTPWVIGFGANWDITPWLEVGAEFRYYINSSYEKQVTTITDCKDKPGANCPLQTALPNGFVTPKHLHDTFHTGGGFKVRPLRKLDLDLFTGMHYETASSPDNTVEVSAPSFTIAAYHIGARWGINDYFRLALSYSYYWYLERTTTDSITSPPTNFIGSGNCNLVALVLELRLKRGIGTR
jgi:long-subunit fatty acid transport protein